MMIIIPQGGMMIIMRWAGSWQKANCNCLLFLSSLLLLVVTSHCVFARPFVEGIIAEL